LFQNWVIHDIREYAIFLLLHVVPNLFSGGILSIINVLAPTVCFRLIHSRYQGACHFSAPTVCTKLFQSRYFEYNKRFGSYSVFQNHFIHDIREYATFLLQQFVSKLIHSRYQGVCHFSTHTVCTKLVQSRYFEYNKRFGSYSVFQNHFIHDIMEYPTIFPPNVCNKLVQWWYYEYNNRFGSYNLFQNWFIHDIREYAIFLLLHVVPNLFSGGILSITNVLAPTVCFRIDSFTISGSMPFFCSYSLYQTCSVEVFGV